MENELVALLAEGVDRNCAILALQALKGVALLAEGVDRNWMLEHRIQKREVALLAEGVDRNSSLMLMVAYCAGRPPRGGRG